MSDKPTMSIPDTTPPEVWVVRAVVTDPTAYRDYFVSRGRSAPRAGDPEWRFHDCDPDTSAGCASSTDYADLADGLRDHSGYLIHYVGDDPSLGLYERWEAYAALRVNSHHSYRDILDEVRDAAHEQGVLGPLLEGLEQRQ